MRTTHPRRAPLAGLCAALSSADARGSRRPGRRHWSRRRSFELACRPDRAYRGRRRSRRGRFQAVYAVPRAALRRSPDRRTALAAPAAAAAPWDGVRDATQFAPSCPQPSRQPVRAARPLLRGLPVSQRLHADAAARRSTGRCSCGSTAVASPRMAPATTTAPSSPRTAPSWSRSTTGSARSGSLPTRARVATRWPGRQLRPDGPAGGAALGPAQHRPVRRRPAQRDDRRAVGRRRVGARPAGLASARAGCSSGRSWRAARSR